MCHSLWKKKLNWSYIRFFFSNFTFIWISVIICYILCVASNQRHRETFPFNIRFEFCALTTTMLSHSWVACFSTSQHYSRVEHIVYILCISNCGFANVDMRFECSALCNACCDFVAVLKTECVIFDEYWRCSLNKITIKRSLKWFWMIIDM